MKKYLQKISFYIILVLSVHLTLGSFADGNTDESYLKFTSCKQENLILGTSRAAQGIIPQVLHKKITDKKFYNYAFTIGISPYGKTYFEAIQEKLNPSAKEGIYILAVDPWSIASEFKNKKEIINENRSSIGNTFLKNVNPNYEYLIRNYHKSWYYLYRDRADQGKSVSFLNKDGWLEINYNPTPQEYKKNVEKN